MVLTAFVPAQWPFDLESVVSKNIWGHSQPCLLLQRQALKKISKATDNYRRLQLRESGENCLLILVGTYHL